MGIEATIKQIPVKFSGSAASTEERMSNFCRSYKDVRFSAVSASYKSDQVVVDALRAFNRCEETVRKFVFITFVSPNNISSVFTFQFGNNMTYQLQGATLDKGIECKTVNPENNESVTLGQGQTLT